MQIRRRLYIAKRADTTGRCYAIAFHQLVPPPFPPMPASRVAKPLVMVLDHDVVDRATVTRALKGNYRLIEAANGTEARDLLLESPPDCIVLDYHIPRTDTLELVAELTQRFPVVVLTGQGDEAVATSLMKAGAQDYLRKADCDAAGIRQAVVTAIEKATREREQHDARRRLVEDHQREKDRREHLEGNMLVARDIQQRLVPTSPPHAEGLDIAGVYLPSDDTSGDFFTYVTFSDATLGIAIGDVAGHGVGPALLASELRAMVRALSCNDADLGRITRTMNRLFWEDTSEARFATFVFARIDPRTRMLEHASAGQISFLVRPGGESLVLKGDSFALGLMPDCQVTTEGPIPLQAGDVLLLTTDGLHEAVSSKLQRFGTDNCIDEVRRHINEPAARPIR